MQYKEVSGHLGRQEAMTTNRTATMITSPSLKNLKFGEPHNDVGVSDKLTERKTLLVPVHHSVPVQTTKMSHEHALKNRRICLSMKVTHHHHAN
jgi:hypothetical protein